jgi:signal transduction histidine kinase
LENLLSWSRSQSGIIEFRPEKLKIADLVNETIQLFESNAKNKSIHLDTEIDEYCTAFADKNMIGTVLRNLCSNAIKYTSKGGKVIIKCSEAENDIEISVNDTGVGIPPKEINNLFKLDVHRTTKGTADEKGTGLGLILCKEFVEKHGGEIWVESKKGEGSSFKFTIRKP